MTLPAWLEVNVGGRNGHFYMPPIPEVPTYDADGNLTSDSRWDYAWDAENRLIGMTTRPAAVAAGAPNQRLSFVYDYQSRRISKKIEKLNPSLSVWELTSELRFVYDGWNVIAEIQMKGDAADAPNGGITQGIGLVRRPYPVRSYVWGPDMSGTEGGAGGVGGLLAMTRHSRQGKAAESYWATWDLNGNVIGLVSTTKEGRMALYDYDAFGQTIRVNEPEADLNPVRFSSKYTDEETGLVYYGYRYYSPEGGRWISRDPIEERGGLNLYGMVGNDVVNSIDFLGLVYDVLITREKPFPGHDSLEGKYPDGKYFGREYVSVSGSWAIFETEPGKWKDRTHVPYNENNLFYYETNLILNGALQGGEGKGCPCLTASKSQVYSCLDKLTKPRTVGTFHGLGICGNNCRAAILEVLSQCCLAKGKLINPPEINYDPNKPWQKGDRPWERADGSKKWNPPTPWKNAK